MSTVGDVRALLISPDRVLARQFAAAQAESGCFEIIAELSDWPADDQELESLLKQHRPHALLVDAASDLQAACRLIQAASRTTPAVEIIALHHGTDAQAILTALRSGAREFLSAPFDAAVQRAAVARIRKSQDPSATEGSTRGRVVAFAGAKPGCGVTTLTLETARALKKAGQRRVVVIDLNLAGGSAAFLSNIHSDASVVDLLAPGTRIDHGAWASVARACDGFEVLGAPALPKHGLPDGGQLSAVLAYARTRYEWVLLDLPSVIDRLALTCISEADRVFVVTTSELAGLHLARRAVRFIRQLGLDIARVSVLLNQTDERSDLSGNELKKLFDCDIERRLPSDAAGLSQAVARNRPLAESSSLSKAIQAMAAKLCATLGAAATSGDAPAASPAAGKKPAGARA